MWLPRAATWGRPYFSSPITNLLGSSGIQHYLVDIYVVSVFSRLAGVGAVTQANSDFLYRGQIYAAITEQPKSNGPLTP